MRPLRVAVLCESSGAVRRTFRERGHLAYSFDLLPADDGSAHHIQGDIRETFGDFGRGYWDVIIAHPPCTYLTSSAEWAYGDGPYHQRVKPGTLVGAARRQARQGAHEFVRWIAALPCRVGKAIENPRGALSSLWRKPDQTIQPYHFGHDASKATCLWLDGLPKLMPTELVRGRIVRLSHTKFAERWANQTDSGQNRLSPSADRWKERSATYAGIASAMADQWSRYASASLREIEK
jgi:hypothetical protein